MRACKPASHSVTVASVSSYIYVLESSGIISNSNLQNMTQSLFYFTKAGIIIPTVTGTISFLSSSAIIYVILRSKSGIKTTYHRIILGLSIADCITSFVILLTTIPMPKNVIYPFALASYGNVATCEAQGLIYIIGNVALLMVF